METPWKKCGLANKRVFCVTELSATYVGFTAAEGNVWAAFLGSYFLMYFIKVLFVVQNAWAVPGAKNSF